MTKDGNYIVFGWAFNDERELSLDLNDEQAEEMLEIIDLKHAASVGIQADLIEDDIDSVAASHDPMTR